ncbi:MAG: membrane-bound PQQ-dependent dehydrogenase, glucose/quinate/shikimate family [Pseudomonadota bacterium]|nr:membrane-bound PQQ-dependent dehydrogenase, glucose/quinate/shikimate family [Pseudomonadota bacterium]
MAASSGTIERQHQRGGFARWAPLLLGGFIGLFGLALAGGGSWLLAVGGSGYYLAAGLVLLVCAVLMMRRSLLGAWIYIGFFTATVVWALWEVGLDGWALVARLTAFAVLLVLTILVMPLMTAARRWMPACSSAGAFIIAAAIFSFGIAHRNQPRIWALPQIEAASMADASATTTGADWPAYGGTQAARRFSPLSQITPQNVGRLSRAWVAHTGDLPDSRAAQQMYGAETTPIKIDDSLYLCSAKNILISLDPQTGKERWRYDPSVPDEAIPYTAACRGVSHYSVPDAAPESECAHRIIEGTLDGRLIAVDARNGRPCSGFGENGQVDIKVGMGETYPGMVSITSPPTIVRGVLVTGHQVLDGQKRDAPSGVIQGYDAVTGQLRWAWDMTRPDITALPPPGETYTRGTPNMWTTASGDEALGLVYLPMGNSAVDYWSSDRHPLANEYATSLVALDVTTGRPAWSFQTTRKDVWDYDLGSQATLVDFPAQQGSVPALLLPSKQGDIYVLDRRTGAALVTVADRPVPAGGVEPLQRAATQPFSTYHTLRQPDLRERDMWGMTPIDQMICRIQFRKASYQGIYTPPTAERHSVEYPGYNGGSDWGGIAVDPRRGVIVANYNDMPNYVRLVPRAQANRLGWAPREAARGKFGGAEGAGDPQMGAPYAVDVNAGWRLPVTGLLCKQPPYGGIRAIELSTGRTLWDRPFGTARRNGPFGIPSMLPISIGTPNNGGAVITASGLIFIAAATDDLIRAIDLRTGETLWQDVLPAGGQATPMTYQAGGKQYLVIMAGGHHFMETRIGDAVIAYALP